MSQGVLVFGFVGDENVVQSCSDAVVLGVAVEGDLAAAGYADIAQGDIAVGRQGVTLQGSGSGVARIEGDWVG